MNDHVNDCTHYDVKDYTNVHTNDYMEDHTNDYANDHMNYHTNDYTNETNDDTNNYKNDYILRLHELHMEPGEANTTSWPHLAVLQPFAVKGL